MALKSRTADAPPLIMLDACCLLNLYATGCMGEILRAVGGHFGVALAVEREALWVFRGGEAEDAGEREQVDLQPLIETGLLEVLELVTDEELATFVDFAALLDDGEAATMALAIHRGAAVATDDRKALRELRAHAPTVEIWTSARLLRGWSEATGAPPSRVAAVLRAVRLRARFEPGQHDPLAGWWASQLTRA